MSVSNLWYFENNSSTLEVGVLDREHPTKIVSKVIIVTPNKIIFFVLSPLI